MWGVNTTREVQKVMTQQHLIIACSPYPSIHPHPINLPPSTILEKRTTCRPLNMHLIAVGMMETSPHGWRLLIQAMNLLPLEIVKWKPAGRGGNAPVDEAMSPKREFREMSLGNVPPPPYRSLLQRNFEAAESQTQPLALNERGWCVQRTVTRGLKVK